MDGTQDNQLVHLEEADAGGFDVVLRGYDRRQVEDYVHRVELALGDADRIHAEDQARIAAIEEELAQTRLSLGEAQRRAEGQPDPASLVGERLTQMLRLAEQEAEEIVAHARERAARSTQDREAELTAREAAVASAGEAAARTRLEAQQDAEALREKARQEAEQHLRAAQQQAEALLASAQEEAERRRRTAEEDVAILHEDARGKAQQVVAEAQERAQRGLADAQAQVEDLARQRDTIAAQLAELRARLAEAMRPLGDQQ